MKYIIIGVALCVGLQVTTLAQSQSLNPTFENIFPPSPNAAALGKFGSLAIGQSTGIPEVKVPIFTWEGKGFGRSVSISLDYHAGGIQVDQMASNVGLGWALNAGGVISRTMRGIQDEFSDNGFLYKAPPVDEYVGNGPTDFPPEERIFNKMYSGKVDSQNDLFNFNFNGRSGRFVLGRNNDILILDQSKLRIEKFISNPAAYDSKIFKFIITDEFGYKYEFNDYEVTMTSIVSIPPPHTSSWYLSKITNPSETESIIFEYEDYLLNVIQTGRSQSLAIPVTLDGTSLTANLGGNSVQTVNGKRIKKITFTDNSSVSFTYKQAVRTDQQSGSTDKALEKILIENGTKSYGYLLTQDYSLGNRLTLLSVQQHGSSEQETIKPYQFVYSPELLPARFSSKKDHWGYANRNPSESLIPKEYLLVGDTDGPYAPYREFLGGDRDTDPNLVKAGSLIKMIYPTGGYTEFEMEANTAVDQWLNKAVTTEVPNPYTEYSTNEPITTYPGGAYSFTFQGANNTSTLFELSVNPYTQNCSNCGVKFELYNSSGGLMSIQSINFPSPNSNRQTLNFGMVNLTKGAIYTFKIYVTGLSNYYDYAEIKRKETNPPGTTTTKTFGTNQLYVGGLRAKRIIDYTSTGTVASSREYEYVLEGNLISSGSLGYRPIYSYFAKYDLREVLTSGDGGPYYQFRPHADYVIRTSSSVNEIPMVSGSPVTYKRVVEKIGQNGSYIGKTVRVFSTFADSPPFISEDLPTIPAQYSSWNYGQLKSEEAYDSDNSMVKKTENLYFNFLDGYSGDQNRVENFRSISFAPFSFQSRSSSPKLDPAAYPGYFLMKSFTPVAGKADLSQSTVTDYVGGLPATKVITNYDYDPNYYYLKEVRTTKSDNVVIKKALRYPKDMVDANEDAAIYNGMLGINMINPVIVETQFVGATQTFATKKKYKNWSGSLFAPELVSTKTLANAENVRLRYLEYNTNGTPVSVQREKGVIINYIWSYKMQYPIAEIRNGDYNAILTALGGSANVNNFSNGYPASKAAIDSFLGPIRNSNTTFKDTQVTSYTYEPLGGMTSSTDPKGMTTYYEYDNFQRLKNIKDQNLNIIKNYDYHYKP